MAAVLVERQVVSKRHDFPVNTGAHVAFANEIFERVAEFAFLFAGDGGEDEDAGAFRCVGRIVPGFGGIGSRLGRCWYRSLTVAALIGAAAEFAEDRADDLIDRLRRNGFAALRAMLQTDPGVQDSQKVVNRRDRAHGRSRIPARRLLLDGDGGRETGDQIAIGFLHLPHELPGVGTERLDISALPFGVERVKSEGALAAAGDAREADQLVPRQRHRHAAQVVHAGVLDFDRFGFHSGRDCRRERVVSATCAAMQLGIKARKETRPDESPSREQ